MSDQLLTLSLVLTDIALLMSIGSRTGSSQAMKELFERVILPGGMIVISGAMFFTFVPQVFSQTGEIATYAQQIKASGDYTQVYVGTFVSGVCLSLIFWFMRALERKP